MTIIDFYRAKCKDCGAYMIKHYLLSYSETSPVPDHIDLSEICTECKSENIVATDDSL